MFLNSLSFQWLYFKTWVFLSLQLKRASPGCQMLCMTLSDMVYIAWPGSGFGWGAGGQGLLFLFGFFSTVLRHLSLAPYCAALQTCSRSLSIVIFVNSWSFFKLCHCLEAVLVEDPCSLKISKLALFSSIPLMSVLK